MGQFLSQLEWIQDESQLNRESPQNQKRLHLLGQQLVECYGSDDWKELSPSKLEKPLSFRTKLEMKSLYDTLILHHEDLENDYQWHRDRKSVV